MFFLPVVVAELCRALTTHLVEQKSPMKGIPLLVKAISKLQLYDTQLTSIHASLCQLCLLAKCFKPALEILDVDITGICQEVENIYIYIFVKITFFFSEHTKSRWFPV